MRSVRSVLEQLDHDDEVIVVNDGSHDSGPKKVQGINDSRLRVINQENSGVSVARNEGVRVAIHPYIAFLDADDEWLPGALMAFKGMIQQNSTCTLYAIGHLRCNYETRSSCVKHSNLYSRREILSGEEFISKYAKSDLVNSSCACVQKNALLRIGGFPQGVTLGEDIYVWLRLAINGTVFVEHSRLAIIERGVPGGSPARVGVPYFLEWLSEEYTESRFVDQKTNAALKSFCFWRGTAVLAGKVMSGQRMEAMRLFHFFLRTSPLAVFVGILIIFQPRFVLTLLYKKRRKIISARN
jgi:glycosyltransferase involved in cell wall biosynthesis